LLGVGQRASWQWHVSFDHPLPGCPPYRGRGEDATFNLQKPACHVDDTCLSRRCFPLQWNGPEHRPAPTTSGVSSAAMERSRAQTCPDHIWCVIRCNGTVPSTDLPRPHLVCHPLQWNGPEHRPAPTTSGVSSAAMERSRAQTCPDHIWCVIRCNGTVPSTDLPRPHLVCHPQARGRWRREVYDRVLRDASGQKAQSCMRPSAQPGPASRAQHTMLAGYRRTQSQAH